MSGQEAASRDVPALHVTGGGNRGGETSGSGLGSTTDLIVSGTGERVKQETPSRSGRSGRKGKGKPEKKRKWSRRDGRGSSENETGAMLGAFVFDLERSRLHLVDSREGLEEARQILERSVLLGLDAETRPSFTAGEWYPTSLLQVATRDSMGQENVILFDLLALEEGLRLPDELSHALAGPLRSPWVPKLGLGLTHDLDELAFAYPDAPFLQEVRALLPVCDLHAMLIGSRPGLSVGLNRLAQGYLGTHMDKKCQRSNWSKRPLSKRQVSYAACDALVLLRIHDAIVRMAAPFDVVPLLKTWTPKPVVPEEHLRTLDTRKSNRALKMMEARDAYLQGRGSSKSKKKRRI